MLILGSLPGRASLEAGRYYAHPRNAFWPIMTRLLGLPAEAPYAQKLLALADAGIALWDVMASGQRPHSSLDADIAPESVVANDFAAFFAFYPTVRRVLFNGAAAEQAFRRHVLPTLDAQGLGLVRLPSTSPAHAALKFADKLSAWSSALGLPNK